MDPPIFSRSLPHLNVILFVVPFIVHATDGLVKGYCCSSGGPATRELYRVQELCESRGGRPGLSPSLIVLTVSMALPVPNSNTESVRSLDVKQH